MKERLNIQQYKAGLHRPNSHEALSQTEALVNTSVGEAGKKTPKEGGARGFQPFQFSRSRTSTGVLYAEWRRDYANTTLPVGYPFPYSSIFPWGWCAGSSTGLQKHSFRLCWNALSAGHATQLWLFIYLYRGISTSIMIPHPNLPMLRLNFYQSGHKFAHALNKERHSFLVT